MSESRPPAMHVAEISKNYKGKRQVTTLVRRTFREGKKVRHETISNISGLAQDLIQSIKVRLKSGLPLVGADEQFIIERSLPHGSVAAVLGTMKKLGMEKLLAHRPCRERQLVLAMIADRVLSPGLKLSCSNGLCAATAQNTLAEELKLGDVDVHELYDAVDWLLDAQARIESKLAKRHLEDGSLVLFAGAVRRVDGFDWVSALRSDGIRKLAEAGHIQRPNFVDWFGFLACFAMCFAIIGLTFYVAQIGT